MTTAGSWLQPRDLGIDKDSWRPSQWEAISDAYGSKKKYVLSEVPTGVGKSVIGVALARLADAERTFYLTGTKQLQDQYLQLPGLTTMKGRGNYACALDWHVTADEGQCTIGKGCDMRGTEGAKAGCPYYDAKRAALTASDLVLNYAYAFPTVNAEKTGLGIPKLMVCDEAHALRQHLESHISIALRTSHLDILGLPWPTRRKVGDAVLVPVATAKELADWAAGALEAVKAIINRFENEHVASHVGGGMEAGERRRRIAAYRLAETLEKTKGTDHETWVVVSNTWGWELKPVWVKGHLGTFLSPVSKTVFLSASILNPTLWMDILGIDPDTVDVFRYPSPFDPARRPLYYDGLLRVSGKDASSREEIVVRVDSIIDRYSGSKGIVHTVSYDLQQAVLRMSRHRKRMLSHTSVDREDVLNEFRGSGDGILVSPSMGTGVDLPGDLLRWQIIVKLPYPSLGDPQRQAQMKTELGQRLYLYDTVCDLVQTYGRAMRSEDDWGDTYLLDGAWDYRDEEGRKRGLKYRVGHMLPSWFKESLQYIGGKGDEVFA